MTAKEMLKAVMNRMCVLQHNVEVLKYKHVTNDMQLYGTNKSCLPIMKGRRGERSFFSSSVWFLSREQVILEQVGTGELHWVDCLIRFQNDKRWLRL